MPLFIYSGGKHYNAWKSGIPPPPGPSWVSGGRQLTFQTNKKPKFCKFQNSLQYSKNVTKNNKILLF